MSNRLICFLFFKPATSWKEEWEWNRKEENKEGKSVTFSLLMLRGKNTVKMEITAMFLNEFKKYKSSYL